MGLLLGELLVAGVLSVASGGGVGFPSCTDNIVWHRGVQVHDIHPATDLYNRPNLSAAECGAVCCGEPRCVAFFHTTDQLTDAGVCRRGGKCCWLKPTFNATRLDDACPDRAACTSGSFVHAGVPTRTIAAGIEMPMLMMGGYEITAMPRQSNYTLWLKLGGRGIDTAYEYNTQHQIAAAIRESAVPRTELFITSKIPCSRAGDSRWPSPFTAADATRMVAADLAQLGLNRIDLMLLHWPCETRVETAEVWAALEALVSAGQLGAIGVSNFNASDLEALATTSQVPPVVNQCAMAAGRADAATIAYCHAHNITYEAYGALQGGSMSNPAVVRIAVAHAVSPAAVLLRWVVQQGVVSVTASTSEVYDREDVGVFDFVLTDAEMATLTALPSEPAAMKLLL